MKFRRLADTTSSIVCRQKQISFKRALECRSRTQRFEVYWKTKQSSSQAAAWRTRCNGASVVASKQHSIVVETTRRRAQRPADITTE